MDQKVRQAAIHPGSGAWSDPGASQFYDNSNIKLPERWNPPEIAGSFRSNEDIQTVSEPFTKANLAMERVSPVTQRIERITGHSAYRQPFRTATPKNIYVPPAQTFTQTSVITPGTSTRHYKPLSEPVGKVSRPLVSRGTPVQPQTLPTTQRNLTPVPVPSDEGRTQGGTNVPRFSLPISASQPPTGPPSGPPGGDPPGSHTGGRNYGYNNSFGLRNQGSIGHTGMGAGRGPPGDPPGTPWWRR